jgi:murein DD-endopeptidase MepM/ murein hydrolase activator NlpD
MFSFLADFFRKPRAPQTVILLDEDGLAQPRRHEVRPATLIWIGAGASVVAGLLLILIVVASPLRTMIPGVQSEETLRDVRLSMLRLHAMQDSLEAQQHYLAHLRYLMIGQMDSVTMASIGQESAASNARSPAALDAGPMVEDSAPADWADHEQPALSFWRFQSVAAPANAPRVSEARGLASLRLPVLPPVEAFLSRGFDARTGHFGVDFAVDVGTVVRSVGDGYVIFADWSHEGGYTITVQHSDGYVSVYKHNQQLMKRVGERVRAREAIALSGDTGETSTGPHLHFEFWHNGLAQDPRYYFVGE